MRHLHFTTPVGTLLFTWNSRGAVARVDWLPLSGPIPDESLDKDHLLSSLCSYFKTGQPIEADIVGGLDSSSWSDFERQVYLAVMRIPHGETRTYSWVAARIGRPGATRAVGQALRRNRHLILVPCHRVVGMQDLGGFMGSDDDSAPELQFKQRLLSWEDSWRNPSFSFLV